MNATAFRIGKTDTWAASVRLNDEEMLSASYSPLALHYVVDNSGSMGRMTEEIKNIFAGMVDSAASAPCSFTLFSSEANLLSSSITSSRELLALPQLRQACTNIPSGVRSAMETIVLKELEENSSGVTNKTHHVLILLTDGAHNTGPGPEREFPKIGRECRQVIPDVQLSVIVVGITRSSSTSMGMLLKTSLETVPLDSDCIENIYFAATRNDMKTVTSKLVGGLNSISRGVVHSVSNSDGLIVSEFGMPPTATVTIRTTPKDSNIRILLESKEPPSHVVVDGIQVEVIPVEHEDYSLVSDTLMKHIDKIRVKRVASADTSTIRSAVNQLGKLIDALEQELHQKDGTKLQLTKVRGADRLAQHRNITKTLHLARELRNQLAEVANFTENSSEAQAAFLTGRKSKFASKAVRRAAARSGDNMVLDPKKEMARVYSELTSEAFANSIASLLISDTISHLARLSTEQLQHLKKHVKAASQSDFTKLRQILNLGIVEASSKKESASVDMSTEKKVHTSALCWIPPEGDVFDSIQSIRQMHDRQIKRWPPHINLLYPFVPTSEFESAAAKLGEAMRDATPFNVTLQDISHFAHGKRSYTAWLRPDKTQDFVALQAACQAAFPHCNDLTTRGPFVPHLTVGQCTGQNAVDALVADAAWSPSPSRCGELCLISRKGPEGPFEVHWRIQLGSGIISPSPSVAVELDAQKKTNDETSSSSAQNFLTNKTNATLDNFNPELKAFVDSGTLAGYLNEVFFGGRQSYLSLSNPWEHVAEWRDLGGSVGKLDFQSQWEMLLYAGSVACPITVERSAGTQMNPFQLAVTKIHTTVIDTASLCCANHSEIDTYGPEGGEPIKDALVLVDPSCPRASAKIASSVLLGETFTSVVVSRDLHMYTGASMKIALMAHSLFRCLQPEPNMKSKSDVLAEIKREFLGTAYQCASCGFGPVDHGGCSDLFAHHGEVDSRGGVASNSCPFCGWFSQDLDDWQPWDGTVPEALIEERVEGVQNKDNAATKPLQAKMDLVLRIIYSFRKLFLQHQKNNPIKELYDSLARKLVDWDLKITTQDDVEGLVQILIAVMACDSDIVGDEKDIEAAFAPPVFLAIVSEACARAARKKFRMAANGDEAKARELAADHVTAMLSISEESAPTTTGSLLEPEPNRTAVEERCSRHYSLDKNDGEKQWVTKITSRWCTAFAIAKALRMSLARRGGGWARLELDMETSLDNYKDVVLDLQQSKLPGDDESSFLSLCGITNADANRTLTAMAAQAFLYNKGASRQDLPDVRCGETLADIARDMRMRIYSQRVREKMAQWASQGEELSFLKARAADIGQYTEMVKASTHVHGLSKEMFWGLWEAAIYDGHRGEKVRAFLETANDGFRLVHAYSGALTGKTKKKRKKRR